MIGGLHNELEDRFGHLLQPIRDLAKSWDVDIASYLTDYLEELDRVTITFDDGKTTMNFAEAALLIQGSACVYSKKVDNLYSLVYQVMDVISNKKSKQKKLNQTCGNVDDGEDDEDDEFLSLDDISIGKNITMREGDKSVLPVKRTPLAIIPLGNSERGHNPLLSKTGEILGSRDDFKMNTCYIHKSGAMLLDVSYMHLLTISLQLPLQLPEPIASSSNVSVGAPEQNQNETEEKHVEHMEHAPTDVSMEEPPLFDNEADENSPPRVEMRERLRPRKPIIEKVVDRKPLSEIFVQLDPYSVSDKPDKNIGKGKILKIPSELKEEDTTKKRKRKTVLEKQKIPISVFIQKTCFSHEEKYTKTIFNTPTFAALENQFWKEHLRRKEIWAKEKKLLKSVNSKQLEEFQNDRDDNLPADNEFGDDDNDDNDVFEAPPLLENLMENEPHSIHDFSIKRDEPTSYEELARQHIERFMACGNNFHTTEIAQKVAEWEEKILPRLEQEERRESFDIHVYGTKILNDMTKENRVKFAQLAAGQADYEICRLFSSLLQLVNSMNVKIHKSEDIMLAMDDFELELLTTKRHHEELANKRYETTEANFSQTVSMN